MLNLEKTKLQTFINTSTRARLARHKPEASNDAAEPQDIEAEVEDTEDEPDAPTRGRMEMVDGELIVTYGSDGEDENEAFAGRVLEEIRMYGDEWSEGPEEQEYHDEEYEEEEDMGDEPDDDIDY